MNNPERNKQCIYCAHYFPQTRYCTRFQFALGRHAGHSYDKHNCIGFVKGTFSREGDRDEKAQD